MFFSGATSIGDNLRRCASKRKITEAEYGEKSILGMSTGIGESAEAACRVQIIMWLVYRIRKFPYNASKTKERESRAGV